MAADGSDKRKGSALGRDLERILGGKYPRPVAIDLEEGGHLLLNHLRRAIFSLLLHSPCSTTSHLASLVNKSPGTVNWHLDKLKSASFVTYRRWGGRDVYYPADYLEVEDVAVFALLAKPSHRAPFMKVAQTPATTVSSLARSIGISQQRAHQIVRDLESAGLVDKIREGRNVHLYQSDVFKVRSEALEKREGAFEATLMELLKRDGMAPTSIAKSADSIDIEMASIERGREVIRFPLNPYTAITSNWFNE